MDTIKEIWDYRDMIVSLVKRDLRGRYKGSVLGFFWTFLNPLLQLLVYTFVFSIIMKAGIEDYYLFLFVALVPWTYFATCVSGGSGCIVGQVNLVNKIYFPREVLPISYVISQLINMLLSFLVVFVVLFISGKGFNFLVWPYLIVVILQETLLAFGITLFVSAISVYFRDMIYFLNIIVMAWQFMTPIIVAYRDIFYYKKAPELQDFILGTVVGIIILVIGWISFEKLKRRFAEVL